ncbi:MAG: MlaD family protein [Lentisphaerota bacterium]
MIEANKVKLGIFITLGTILILAGIFTFGMSQFFVEKVKIYTIFTDDIEGIGVGSPIKYYGVVFGQVTGLYICNDGNVEVEMDLNLGAIEQKMKSHFIELILNEDTQAITLQKEVDEGLRCSLRFRGITGDKYINLGYFPKTNTRNDLRIPSKEPEFYYIPSIPSHVQGAIDNISDIIYDLSQIDFQEVIRNLNRDLHTIGELAKDMKTSLDSVDLQELNSSLINTTNNIDQMAEQITTLSNNLNSNPSSIVWGIKQESTLNKDLK